MTGHELHPSILRAYDIRGIVGETLSQDDAFAIGRAFATRMARAGATRVGVGRDGRLSSPSLEGALVDGLRAGGFTKGWIGVHLQKQKKAAKTSQNRPSSTRA